MPHSTFPRIVNPRCLGAISRHTFTPAEQNRTERNGTDMRLSCPLSTAPDYPHTFMSYFNPPCPAAAAAAVVIADYPTRHGDESCRIPSLALGRNRTRNRDGSSSNSAKRIANLDVASVKFHVGTFTFSPLVLQRKKERAPAVPLVHLVTCIAAEIRR